MLRLPMERAGCCRRPTDRLWLRRLSTWQGVGRGRGVELLAAMLRARSCRGHVHASIHPCFFARLSHARVAMERLVCTRL